MKEQFKKLRLYPENVQRLQQINQIIGEYQRQGYRLTLRQLYYQLVSRDIIPNKLPEYAKLSNILKEGRLAGIVDWNAIEDRLRVIDIPTRWDSPSQIVQACVRSYRRDRQEKQPNYIEVWVEKDALSEVLSRATQPFGVPIMVNRGYSSASAMYDAYQRFSRALSRGRRVTLLYLGDYDPSGVDMIRDVYERPLEMLLAKAEEFIDEDSYKPDDRHDEDFTEAEHLENEYYGDQKCRDEDDYFSVERAVVLDRFKVVSIALTKAQVRQYNPPPNPAKRTDPRSKKFIAEHGAQSWEVDALRPEVLDRILRTAIEGLIDQDIFDEVAAQEKKEKAILADLATKLGDRDDQDDQDEEE